MTNISVHTSLCLVSDAIRSYHNEPLLLSSRRMKIPGELRAGQMFIIDVIKSDLQSVGFGINMFSMKFFTTKSVETVKYCHKLLLKVQPMTAFYVPNSVISFYTPCPEKKGATLFLPVTLRNANRFSKFFHHHTLQ